MTIYDYAQLEGLWDEAGGPPAQASLAAAIAEAESGGNPLAAYPGTTVAPGMGSTTDATGLWQILGLPAGDFTAAELTDPYENAKMAVAKYTQAGDSFTPWQTYDEGDYDLQNVAPTSKGIPTGPGSEPVPDATTTSDYNLIPGWLQGILGVVPGGQGVTELGGLLDPENWIDWLERGALMLFGGILIIIGVVKLTSNKDDGKKRNIPGSPDQEKNAKKEGEEEASEEGASPAEVGAAEDTAVVAA
jgi:hypothetical protein